MDNGKCIMDNDCVAIGDDSKSFPKEIPQLSIIHYPFGFLPDKRELAQKTRGYRRCQRLRKRQQGGGEDALGKLGHFIGGDLKAASVPV